MEKIHMNNKSLNHKHRIGNPNPNFVTNHNNLYSYPSDDLIFSSSLAGGVGLLPLYNSYPPVNLNRHLQQPPLLPLPVHINTNMYRSNSCVTNNIIRVNKGMKTRVRDQSLTPKKSKNQKRISKREQPDPILVVEPDLVAPDPKDLPMDIVSKVLNSSIDNNNKSVDIVDKFSGSVVFTPSPPPSSVPLPTFSLRPKLGCKAQAAGVDAGATDGLRRLLRI